MRALLYIAGGAAAGFLVASQLRKPSGERCCQQLAQLVRKDLGEKCGSAAGFCESVSGALGLDRHVSAFLDLIGVTKP